MPEVPTYEQMVAELRAKLADCEAREAGHRLAAEAMLQEIALLEQLVWSLRRRDS